MTTYEIIATASAVTAAMLYVIDRLLTRAVNKREEDIKSLVDSLGELNKSFSEINLSLNKLVQQHEATDERSRDAMALARINKETLMENSALLKSQIVEIQSLRDWKHKTNNIIQNLILTNEKQKLKGCDV